MTERLSTPHLTYLVRFLLSRNYFCCGTFPRIMWINVSLPQLCHQWQTKESHPSTAWWNLYLIEVICGAWMKSYLWEPEQLVDSYTTTTNTPPPPPLPPPSPPPPAKQLSSERRDASCTSAPPCEPPPPPRGNSNIDYLMRIITIVLVSRWQCLCRAAKRVPQHSTSSPGFRFF